MCSAEGWIPAGLCHCHGPPRAQAAELKTAELATMREAQQTQKHTVRRARWRMPRAACRVPCRARARLQLT